MQQLLRSEAPFARDGRVLLVCASGRRSLATAQTLQERGFTAVESLRGGVAALLAPQT